MENKNEKFKIWWDEENQIVMSELIGDQNEGNAENYVSRMRELLEGLSKGNNIKRIDSINDATRAGTSYSPQTRKVYTNWLKEGKEKEYFNKTAIVGLKPANRMIVNFLIGFSGERSIKFFPTKKEALKWIRK